MTKSNHIHKYKRLRYKTGNIIFFCVLPDCSNKCNIALALGKRSICWRCGESFIMSEYALRLAKPHCDSCHKPKNGLIEVGPGILQDSLLLESMHPQPELEELSLAEKMQMEIHKAQEKEEEI
jgi:hypothetical protein